MVWIFRGCIVVLVCVDLEFLNVSIKIVLCIVCFFVGEIEDDFESFYSDIIIRVRFSDFFELRGNVVLYVCDFFYRVIL